MSDSSFEGFPKIARLSRDIIITEKIDGTNAQIWIPPEEVPYPTEYMIEGMLAGSRSHWLTPGKQDNHGFASWVKENAEELFKLGPGRHFGEWWGSKIQRGYGKVNGEKHFSLFNVHRWAVDEARPACCSVVPILYQGEFHTEAIEDCLEKLRREGSKVSPGYMNPEGVVVFHTASGALFKKTLKDDEKPKGEK
jgi:RNA ligase